MADGKELTTWFSSEGDTVFSMLSCYLNKPGHDYVQILEKSEVYIVSMNDLDNLYNTNIEIANWGRIIHQNAFLSL